MKKILPSGRSGKIFLTFLTKFLNKPKNSGILIKPGCIIQELYDISIRKNLDSDSIINIKTDYLYKYHTLRRKIQ